MAHELDADDLRRFAGRDWARVREAKERAWARDAEALGAAAGLFAAEAMREHLRLVDPSWPADQDRADDLAHHQRIAKKLRRLAHVFGR